MQYESQRMNDNNNDINQWQLDISQYLIKFTKETEVLVRFMEVNTVDSTNTIDWEQKSETFILVFQTFIDLCHKFQCKLSTSDGQTHTALSNLMNTLDSTITAFLVPLVRHLPVLYDVSSVQWAKIVFIVNRSNFSFADLIDTIVAAYATDHNSSSSHGQSTSQLTVTLQSFELAFNDYRDRSILSIISMFEVTVVDNIYRQEWNSNNAYMRDKKITHGIVAISATVRSTLDVMFACCDCSSYSNDTETYLHTVLYITLQLLLSSLSLVIHNYLILSPSRVRLFQWRVDLCHMLYTTMDTLSQLINCVKHVLFRRKVANDLSAQQSVVDDYKCSDGSDVVDNIIDKLLTSDDTTFLLHELCTLVHYIIITVVVTTTTSSTAGVSSLLSVLTQICVNEPNVIKTMQTNPLDVLIDMFKYMVSEDTVNHLFKTKSSCIVTSNSHIAFDLTADTVGYCGFQANSAHVQDMNLNEVDTALFTQEQKGKPNNLYAGIRGVIFQRIVTMFTSHAVTSDIDNSQSLIWTYLQNNCDAFLCLHNQLLADGEDSPCIDLGEYFNTILQRRFEMISSEYPQLNELQRDNADKIRAFMNNKNESSHT